MRVQCRCLSVMSVRHPGLCILIFRVWQVQITRIMCCLCIMIKISRYTLSSLIKVCHCRSCTISIVGTSQMSLYDSRWIAVVGWLGSVILLNARIWTCKYLRFLNSGKVGSGHRLKTHTLSSWGVAWSPRLLNWGLLWYFVCRPKHWCKLTSQSIFLTLNFPEVALLYTVIKQGNLRVLFLVIAFLRQWTLRPGLSRTLPWRLPLLNLLYTFEFVGIYWLYALPALRPETDLVIQVAKGAVRGITWIWSTLCVVERIAVDYLWMHQVKVSVQQVQSDVFIHLVVIALLISNRGLDNLKIVLLTLFALSASFHTYLGKGFFQWTLNDGCFMLLGDGICLVFKLDVLMVILCLLLFWFLAIIAKIVGGHERPVVSIIYDHGGFFRVVCAIYLQYSVISGYAANHLPVWRTGLFFLRLIWIVKEIKIVLDLLFDLVIVNNFCSLQQVLHLYLQVNDILHIVGVLISWSLSPAVGVKVIQHAYLFAPQSLALFNICDNLPLRQSLAFKIILVPYWFVLDLNVSLMIGLNAPTGSMILLAIALQRHQVIVSIPRVNLTAVRIYILIVPSIIHD